MSLLSLLNTFIEAPWDQKASHFSNILQAIEQEREREHDGGQSSSAVAIDDDEGDIELTCLVRGGADDAPLQQELNEETLSQACSILLGMMLDNDTNNIKSALTVLIALIPYFKNYQFNFSQVNTASGLTELSAWRFRDGIIAKHKSMNWLHWLVLNVNQEETLEAILMLIEIDILIELSQQKCLKKISYQISTNSFPGGMDETVTYYDDVQRTSEQLGNEHQRIRTQTVLTRVLGFFRLFYYFKDLYDNTEKNGFHGRESSQKFREFIMLVLFYLNISDARYDSDAADDLGASVDGASPSLQDFTFSEVYLDTRACLLKLSAERLGYFSQSLLAYVKYYRAVSNYTRFVDEQLTLAVNLQQKVDTNILWVALDLIRYFRVRYSSNKKGNFKGVQTSKEFKDFILLLQHVEDKPRKVTKIWWPCDYKDLRGSLLELELEEYRALISVLNVYFEQTQKQDPNDAFLQHLKTRSSQLQKDAGAGGSSSMRRPPAAMFPGEGAAPHGASAITHSNVASGALPTEHNFDLIR